MRFLYLKFFNKKMGLKQNFSPPPIQNPIIHCPQCPYIPLLGFYFNENKVFMIQYKCSIGHFDKIELSNFLNECTNDNIGKICNECKSKNQNTLEYCIKCYKLLCNNCLIEHNKNFNNHIIIPYNKINLKCLKHGRNTIGFCFSCKMNICNQCENGTGHNIKKYDEILPDQYIIDCINYDFTEIFNYYNFMKKEIQNNFHSLISLFEDNFTTNFNNCVQLSNILISYYNNMIKSRDFIGEIILNYENALNFDYDTHGAKNNMTNYLRNHYILKCFDLRLILDFSRISTKLNINNLKGVQKYKTNSKIEYIHKLIILKDGNLAYLNGSTKAKILDKNYNLIFSAVCGIDILYDIIQISDNSIICTGYGLYIFNYIDKTSQKIELSNKVKNVIELHNQSIACVREFGRIEIYKKTDLSFIFNYEIKIKEFGLHSILQIDNNTIIALTVSKLFFISLSSNNIIKIISGKFSSYTGSLIKYDEKHVLISGLNCLYLVNIKNYQFETIINIVLINGFNLLKLSNGDILGIEKGNYLVQIKKNNFKILAKIIVGELNWDNKPKKIHSFIETNEHKIIVAIGEEELWEYVS